MFILRSNPMGKVMHFDYDQSIALEVVPMVEF